MIFNLALVIYWRVITASKHCQLDIDNAQENARQVMHNYSIYNIVYVEMNGIYRKLDYSKHVIYRITQLLTNVTV